MLPRSFGIPKPERVCPTVQGNRHKSQPFCFGMQDWKRGTNTWNPRAKAAGSSQMLISSSYLYR
ncbi:hypothetical protein Krac_11373 [Ktedonobacter racemifer DSM 44963]|uniref:Uncharacterized protein n=1 Tax=Ktedonobacter racemifer DSM 44963 TaxID=485913 RepID=D6TK43_KTERA|nr:hypothetical protein Krac_11373 [Ktedonobacter racemifer DSM 44963]